jgi:hypothetical protein
MSRTAHGSQGSPPSPVGSGSDFRELSKANFLAIVLTIIAAKPKWP